MTLSTALAVECRPEAISSAGDAAQDRLDLLKVRQTSGEECQLIRGQAGNWCTRSGVASAHTGVDRNRACSALQDSHNNEEQQDRGEENDLP